MCMYLLSYNVDDINSASVFGSISRSSRNLSWNEIFHTYINIDYYCKDHCYYYYCYRSNNSNNNNLNISNKSNIKILQSLEIQEVQWSIYLLLKTFLKTRMILPNITFIRNNGNAVLSDHCKNTSAIIFQNIRLKIQWFFF